MTRHSFLASSFWSHVLAALCAVTGLWSQQSLCHIKWETNSQSTLENVEPTDLVMKLSVWANRGVHSGQTVSLQRAVGSDARSEEDVVKRWVLNDLWSAESIWFSHVGKKGLLNLRGRTVSAFVSSCDIFRSRFISVHLDSLYVQSLSWWAFSGGTCSHLAPTFRAFSAFLGASCYFLFTSLLSSHSLKNSTSVCRKKILN